MSTPQKAELIAEIEKQTRAFNAGMQALVRLRESEDDAAWREAWEKTKAAKEAYDAAVAQISTASP
jgi:hypothetical protein